VPPPGDASCGPGLPIHHLSALGTSSKVHVSASTLRSKPWMQSPQAGID
jgi:hypothetical protein